MSFEFAKIAQLVQKSLNLCLNDVSHGLCLFAVFLTQKSSALWIKLPKPAIKLSSLALELTNSPKLASIESTLMERQTKMLSKDHQPCRDYHVVGGYEDCITAFLSSRLRKTLNCSIPGQLENASRV